VPVAEGLGCGTVRSKALDGLLPVEPLGATGCAMPVVPVCAPMVGLAPPGEVGSVVMLPAGALFEGEGALAPELGDGGLWVAPDWANAGAARPSARVAAASGKAMRMVCLLNGFRTSSPA
jgi:hypothetical protein